MLRLAFPKYFHQSISISKEVHEFVCRRTCPKLPPPLPRGLLYFRRRGPRSKNVFKKMVLPLRHLLLMTLQ
jgi:hypothetical protein